jgi:hypothetical protein
MKRDTVFYVMPMGEIWLVRAIGSSAEAYPTKEDALAAAERLAARGARIRVLPRSDNASVGPSLARTTFDRVLQAIDDRTPRLESVAS